VAPVEHRTPWRDRPQPAMRLRLSPAELARVRAQVEREAREVRNAKRVGLVMAAIVVLAAIALVLR
jgi:hypothetical protein